jgi:hypothetical protein
MVNHVRVTKNGEPQNGHSEVRNIKIKKHRKTVPEPDLEGDKKMHVSASMDQDRNMLQWKGHT